MRWLKLAKRSVLVFAGVCCMIALTGCGGDDDGADKDWENLYSTENLEGTWTISYDSGSSNDYTFDNTGDMTSTTDSFVATGRGLVDINGNVTITFITTGNDEVILTGTMTGDKKSMSGSFTMNAAVAGTWTATKH